MEAGLGNSSFVFLDVEGNVWGYGPSECPILKEAAHACADPFSPRKIPNLPAMDSISVASTYALFIDTERNIWLGGIYHGLHVTKPIQMRANFIPKVIKALNNAAYVISEEGDLWKLSIGFTENEGREDSADQPIASPKWRLVNIPGVKVVSGTQEKTLLIDSNGCLWRNGASIPDFERINHPNSFVDACGGFDHYLFLDKDGNVWGYGSNRFGQLGLPLDVGGTQTMTKVENIPRMKFISAGRYSSIMIDEFGNTWGCGKNLNGKFGLDCNLNSTVLQIIPEIPKMKLAFCEDEHAVYVDEYEQVYACGLNRGQLETDLPKLSKLTVYSALSNIPIKQQYLSVPLKSARTV